MYIGVKRVAHGGLKRLAEIGFEAASLLGDPAYYGRFGFSPELAVRIEAPAPLTRTRVPGHRTCGRSAGRKTVRGDFPAVISTVAF